jgi:hypothetical protein
MMAISKLTTLALVFLSLCLTGMATAAQTEESGSGDRIATLTICTINQINDANPWDYYFGCTA